MSIEFVRQNRQGMKLDAFVVEFLGLLGRGLAVDRAVLGFAGDRSCAPSSGNCEPTWLAVVGDVVAQFLELFGASFALAPDIMATAALADAGNDGGATGAGRADGGVGGGVWGESWGGNSIGSTASARASRGAMIAFSTFVEPHTGQLTKPRFACLS